jgi:hypothetical protein
MEKALRELLSMIWVAAVKVGEADPVPICVVLKVILFSAGTVLMTIFSNALEAPAKGVPESLNLVPTGSRANWAEFTVQLVVVPSAML